MKVHNGIYAHSERNASFKVFSALGFSFEESFNLSSGDLINGTLVNIGRDLVPPRKPIYQVIDRKTGLQVGKDYSCARRAKTRVDKLDNIYGAYRYTVKTIYTSI